jgi:PKD repeat protein
MASLRRLLIGFGVAACFVPSVATATSYWPMSDANLAGRAAVIVRARVQSQRIEVVQIDGHDRPVTVVTLETLETFKGSPPRSIEVRLPGGHAGGVARFVVGTPSFERGQEAVLFLDNLGGSGAFRLSEFGLSKFDLVSDEKGRQFAVRRVFTPESDLVLSGFDVPRGSGDARVKASVPQRDAASFLDGLRALRRNEAVPAPVLASPVGDLGRRVRVKWVNLSGKEPGIPYYCDDPPCLRRWFFDQPPVAPHVPEVVVKGEQTNLVDDEPHCGTNSTCHVENALTQWSGVSGVRLGFSEVRAEASDGPTDPFLSNDITISLDLNVDLWSGLYWDAPAPCERIGGVAAVTSSSWQYDPPDPPAHLEFRGESYLPIAGSEIEVRRVACEAGLRARDFGSIVIHEFGHALGLGHPDWDASMHSTTTPEDWRNAVMFSSRPLSEPLTPQTDDIAAIRYYYALDLSGARPIASFTISPAHPVTGDVVTFTDTSTESPIAWYWTVADPLAGGMTSRERNPRIGLLGAGVYPVTLLAANQYGAGTVTGEVTVQSAAGTPCVADERTLCLHGGRFKAVVDWTKTSGATGWGIGIALTDESGYFWFFQPDNVEVVVKVLDACSTPSPSYWVFAAGLTNLGSNLVVTDTVTGQFRLYTNPVGTPYQPIQDTAAFACP